MFVATIFLLLAVRHVGGCAGVEGAGGTSGTGRPAGATNDKKNIPATAGMSVQEVSYFGDVNPGSKMEDWQLWKYRTSYRTHLGDPSDPFGKLRRID